MNVKNELIYLNNAATSWPKPDCVLDAVQEAVRSLPPGQYRSGGSVEQMDVFDECRALLGKLLGIADSGRIFFTSGATESMNLVLSGLGIPAEQVITTVTEHNSVLRPLHNLPGIAGNPILLPCDENGVADPAEFEKVVKAAAERNPGLLVLNHCSNVTGAVQDAAAFGEIAKRYGMLFVLDVSQSAGCMEVNADAWKADGVIFTGHKSLMGVSGTGGFYLREGVPFTPARYGGTGRESEKLVFGPGEAAMEVGTQNVPGICALRAGAKWILEQDKESILGQDRIAVSNRNVKPVWEQDTELALEKVKESTQKKGIEEIWKHERNLRRLAVEVLSEIKGITLYGADLKSPGPVLSFNADALSASDLGYILSSSFHIVTRSGLHCTPLIHDCIGSGKTGTVRISFSPFNSEEDVHRLADALQQILHGIG